MPTLYPSAIQTFTDPSGTSLLTSPDHAALHTDSNDTLEALQSTVGTTAGTNVLKDFAAGNFPARMNTSNVLQQAISGTVSGLANFTSGTISGILLGTSQITGGTVTNAVLPGQTVGTNRVTDFSSTATTATTLLSADIVLGANTSGNVNVWAFSGCQAAGGYGALLSRGTTNLTGVAGTAGSMIGGKAPVTLLWRDTSLAAGTYTYALKVRAASGTVFCNAATEPGDMGASLLIVEDPKH